MFLKLPSTTIINLDHLHSLTPDPSDPTRIAAVIDHAAPKVSPQPRSNAKGKPSDRPGFEDQPREVLVLSGEDAAAVLAFFGPGGAGERDGLVEGLGAAEAGAGDGTGSTTEPTP